MSQRLKKSIFALGLSLVVIGLLILGALFFLQPPGGRTNLLVLGMGGEEHLNPDLTDSVIFISVENQTGQTLVLSLPRDIWIAPLRAKLNAVYHYEGLAETKNQVSEILGQKIDYALVVDFNLFMKLVDFLGGVEVDVKRSFDDFKYPLAGRENDLCDGDPAYGCRYESLHFDQGLQVMNGERALKYVRSRNAQGDEGTDFARSQRQQRLLLAIQHKIFTPQVILNPRRLMEMKNLILANIKTDIPTPKNWDLFKIGLRLRKNKFKMEVLNEGLLINPPASKQKYDNQWVLVPQTGDWQEVQKHVRGLIEEF
ncbi:LytR family transcriptional regulator [Candidatus Shapirobacteria bacterium]|nr:LytR family transcriptional regulator [Candidatus Shapirobacteria bacterium]